MATEDELIGRFSLKPVSDDEESLVGRFGLKPIDAPEPTTGPVGPSGGTLKPNVQEGVRVAKDLAAQQAAAAAAQQQQAAAQQQTDPRQFSVSQTKKMFADMRKAQGGVLSREQEAAERVLMDIKQEELNAPAEMAAEEKRVAEPYFKALERSKKIEELSGQVADGPVETALGVGAGAVQGGLGILESLFRTPDAVARGLLFVNDMPGIRGKELFGPEFESNGVFPKPIMDKIRKEQAEGFATANIADQIKIATKTLPLLSPVFAKNEILGKQAEKATEEALKYAYTLGKEGNPHELFEVVTNPHAWGAFIGQAAPSLFAAYKSGGSLGFLAWMEGMETANDAADFEKQTGIKISDQEFVQATTQAAVVNSILEKIVPDEIRQLKAGSKNIFKIAAAAPLMGAKESGTETLQALNSNLAKKFSYDEKQKVTEGLLSSAMGGFGSGAGASTVAAASRQPAAPATPAAAQPAAPVQAPGINPAPIPTAEKQTIYDKYIAPAKDEAEAKENAYVRENIDKVDAAYDEAVKTEYQTDTANVVAADLVKTMDVEGRPAFTAEQSQVRHEASSAFAKMKYEQLLKDPDTQQDPVMVLGGISGAGKTSSIKTLGVDTGDFAAVYDTNLTSKATGERIIEQAISSNPNRQVVVTYVDRDPIKAFKEGVYTRFQNNPERRIVPVDVHVNNYKSRQAIEELYQKYKDNPRVTFKFLDNNSGPGQVKEVGFDGLAPVRYTPDEVKNELTNFIQERIAAGDRISAQEAQTFFGRYDQGTARSSNVQPLQEAQQSTADEDKVVAAVGAKPADAPAPSQQTAEPAPATEQPAEVSEEGARVFPFTKRGTPGPVRQNARKEGTSRAFERVRNRLSEISEEDPLTYNTVDLAEDTSRAIRFVSEFPDQARRVAMGFDPPPAGVTETAISIAYAEQMREEGKHEDMAEAEKSRSLRQTRRGQEIAAERGRANEHSASHFIQLVIRHRLENAGRDLFGGVRGIFNKAESTSKKRGVNRADKMAAVAKQQLDAKKLSIQEAQSIIDGLMC